MGPKQSKRGDDAGMDPVFREMMQKMVEDSGRHKKVDQIRSQYDSVSESSIKDNPNLNKSAQSRLAGHKNAQKQINLKNKCDSLYCTDCSEGLDSSQAEEPSSSTLFPGLYQSMMKCRKVEPRSNQTEEDSSFLAHSQDLI